MRFIIALFAMFISFNTMALGVQTGTFQLDLRHSGGGQVVFKEVGEDGVTYLSCDDKQFSLLHSVDGYGGKMQPVTSLVTVLKNGDNYLNKVDKDFDITTLFLILNDKDVESIMVITSEGEDTITNNGVSQDLFELGGRCQRTPINQSYTTSF